MSNRQDRCRGALIGLAVGDALGAAVEFMPPGSFPPVTGYRTGGPWRLAAGAWTDDTSMALALANSLGRGWDLNDQAREYVAWWQHGKYSVIDRCFDIGITTSSGLKTFQSTQDAASSGSRSPQAAGNGSIMRLAPVPIDFVGRSPASVAAFDWETLAQRAAESSLPTHGSASCLSACRVMAVMLAALMLGEPREAVLAADWPVLARLQAQEPLDPAILEVVQGSYRHKSPPAIRGSGYVVESLEAALWAFHHGASYADAVLQAVNLGHDADTTGAICGQFAGAYWGESGIPSEWRAGLVRPEMIEAALTSLGVGL
jgi:ADP-ribosylglycohydrolase